MRSKNVVQVDAVVTEVQQTNNPKFFNVVLCFPQMAFGKIFQFEDQDEPSLTRILCSTERKGQFMQLKPGTKYHFNLGLGISKANESDGKYYPASVSYDILSAKPV